jgi:hypothetical protein
MKPLTQRQINLADRIYPILAETEYSIQDCIMALALLLNKYKKLSKRLEK